MRRRDLITLLGGAAAAWPLAAGAQQPALPVIGFLGNDSPVTNVEWMRAFLQGLKEAGYVEGDNVTILYRWGEAHPDRLPELAADLVRRRVAVLASFGTASALAAKAATATIPVVFAVSQEPVRLGLVASLARPGGNATGYNFLSAELVSKRLELLRELVPGAAKVAVLVDPAVPQGQTTWRDSEGAAAALGLKIQILQASTSGEINAAFATLRTTAFAQGLAELGWSVGRNLRMDVRWDASDTDRRRKSAEELVALSPDVVLATAGSIVGALQRASRTVPIVFVTTIDPVGGGWVESLARPGGNATGFMSNEFSMGGKRLELLKEIAPRMTRVAVIRDPTVPAGSGGFAAIQTAAPSFNVEATPIGVRDADEIERGIAAFARGANGGLIVVGPASSITRHRDLIITLAAQHRLPAVYTAKFFVTSGGLISYGNHTIDQYRQAAGYVDRILRGEKPADLPVQAPTRYETVLNLKTAKALGLDVPATVLVRADEVIE